MKKLYLICLMLLLCAGYSQAQCDQAFIDKCSSKGSSNIKYVKHFRIRFSEALKGKNVSEGNFSIMLNKGSHYRFFTCNDETKPGHTVVEMSNDAGACGGNINPSTGAEYKAFDFVCTKTGPYYLKMFFKDGKEGCGVCVMTLVTD